MVGKRLVVVGFSDTVGVEIVRSLANRHDWQPIYWFGKQVDQKGLVNEVFPRVPYQAKSDAIHKRFPEKVNRSTWPIADPEVARELARYEPVLFPVFLRESRRPLGMAQCAEYHKAITLWYHFFYSIKPEVALFEGTPDSLYDYLLYLRCKDLRVPALFLLKPYQVPDLLLPAASLEEAPFRIRERFTALLTSGCYKNVELSTRTEKYLQDMRGSYESATYAKFRKRYTIDQLTGRLKLKDTILRKSLDAVRGKNKRVRTMELMMELLTYFPRLRLRRYYESRASEPDFDKPYVYVALHVQPEKTSSPLGGIFGHQLLMVDMLSRAVPEGWLLYVKEHPSQLYYRAFYKFFRSFSFYDDLLEFPNVRLISARIPSFRLIEHAKAVASATSTACWEAVHRGTPALVCGHAWFRDCEGMFYTPTYEAGRRAIERIVSGYQVDQSKIRSYMHVLEREGLPNLIASPNHQLIKEMGQEKAVEYFVNALCERLPPGFDSATMTLMHTPTFSSLRGNSPSAPIT